MSIPAPRSPPARPFLGWGLGLRPMHYPAILGPEPAPVDWFEIISENFMVAGGRPLANLERVRERHPIVMHGVSLSIGSASPLDRDYLRALKALADRLDPPWVSDHLCWTGVDGLNMHDLLPLPQVEQALLHVAERARVVQDYLGRPLLVENVSSYLRFAGDTLAEWDFLAGIAERAGCGILLDVNNVYVNSINHGFDPRRYIDALPPARVWQIHVAGHSDCGRYVIDTHDAPVIDPVIDLLAHAWRRLGPVSTMIERDANIPAFAELVAELDLLRGRAGVGEPA
ncbi:MAG: DUF692 domain-containing protein [Gammaproteobacteria bacterium]